MMWNRKTLKARGKLAFKMNYWDCVLVSFILSMLVGGAVTSGGSSFKDVFDTVEDAKKVEIQDYGAYIKENLELNDIDDIDDVGQLVDFIQRESGLNDHDFWVVVSVVIGVIAIIVVIALLLKILVFNPLAVGGCQFFLRNLEEPVSPSELKRAFAPNWGHNVVTMLLHDVFIVLWSLLLVIPGVVKSYSYRLTPYIQAEYPEMSGTQAITLSRQMMKGYKWRAFVFDLSFLGWYLLSALTFGILNIFYVNPYKNAADAELYCAISDEYNRANGASYKGPEL